METKYLLKKREKKKPMVNFCKSSNNQLIITDNLSKYYSITSDNSR